MELFPTTFLSYWVPLKLALIHAFCVDNRSIALRVRRTEKPTELFPHVLRHREGLCGRDVDPVTKLVEEEQEDLEQVLHHSFPRFLIWKDLYT